MSDFLINYYSESNIKSIRRKAMLKTLLPYVIKYGVEGVTLTGLSEFLNIERKTFYSYYKSKGDIIVDLAFICVAELNNEYMKIANLLAITAENESGLMQMESILLSIGKVIYKKYSDKFIFITKFDLYFHNLDVSSEPFLRYQAVIAQLKSNNHYLKHSMQRHFKNINSELPPQEIANVIEVVEQSFHAYLGRILIKEKESSRYSVENLFLFVKCILHGLAISQTSISKRNSQEIKER